MGAGSGRARLLETVTSSLGCETVLIRDSSASLRAFFSKTLRTHVGEPSKGSVVRRRLSLACKTQENAFKTL